MAFVRIDTSQPWPPARRTAALAEIRDSVSRTLRVPPDDPTVWLVEHDETTVCVPRDMSRSYTVVTITMFAGRSAETKAALAVGVTGALAALGIPAPEVDVLIHEEPRAHWARGGVLASDRDLDFEIEI